MKVSEVIKILKNTKKNFNLECPCCGELQSVAKYELFTEDNLSNGAINYLEEKKEEILSLRKKLNELKKVKLERVQRGTHSSNLGKILEKFVPILPGFTHKPEECIPLFDPIDYISFNGLSDNKIDSITFMDIKTGNGRLASGQKYIRDAIDAGKINLEIIKGASND